VASLARRNLFHDKVRLSVTLTGIVFALVLIAVQTGLFISFATSTSHIIDHSGVDLWVSAKGLLNFDSGYPFPERRLYQVLATPGIRAAEKYIVQQTNLKKPDGGQETVEVVGFNPDTGWGGPWNITAGRLSDLKTADTVFIDELFREKLGVGGPGQTLPSQTVEINGRRARVVGFTRGIRSFTTAPFVFTSFKNARKYTGVEDDKTIFILARAQVGSELGAIKQQLLSRLPGVSVFTTEDLSRQTQFYWMFTTGAGITLIIAAFMGLVVGIVVVAQTIYATTMDHIREFGTLKAIGASNGKLYRIIVAQAVYSAIIGYALGIGISLFLAYLSREATVGILLPWQVVGGLFALTLAMCVGASMVSIHKAIRIDPAMVFKG
jgi:putative ABC transport system permease protein